MSFDITLPDLGDGVESGDVLKVLVKEGDVVKKDQGLLELETDKATVEVPAPRAGQILKVHITAGQTVAVGAPLFTLEGAESVGSGSAAPPAERKATPSSPPSPPAPKETTQDSVPLGTKDGTLKSVAPRREPAMVSGTEKQTGSPVEPDVPPRSPAAPRRRAKSTGPVPAGPAVRRFAREVGVDISSIHGSGPGGRITRNDVLDVVRHANRLAKENGTSADLDANLPGEPANDEFGPVRIESASRIRRTIATRMHESWSTIPRVTNFDDADITELEKIRQSSKDDYAARGVKLTNMPFLVKAASMALRKHSLVNASYDATNGEIIYKRYVNIGMAVDSERGLIVPVLKNTDQLSISEIARLIATTADKVRENSFGLEDLRGGTFTISNLGSIGGSYSTPIVNLPEVAILLTGRAKKMPVVVDDSIAIRLMMPLSLSYDHRLIDGATAARFLNEIIAFLEAPSRLLLAP